MKGAAFEIVVLAASAGGLKALRTVISGLPADFPIPLIVVQHLHPHHPSHMSEILSRHTPLRVKLAAHGERLEPGTIYLAPAAHHLLVKRDRTLVLSQAEPVHFLRPCADLLLESVAASFGAGAIAVVLSGTGRDGAAGVTAIKAKGGTVLAQQGAEFSGMPDAAIATGRVDLVLPLKEISAALLALWRGEIASEHLHAEEE